MKFACYVDTPLQILNSVNFVWHNVENSRGNTDLYLFHQFSAYKEIENRLRASGIFRNIYSCTPPQWDERGPLHYLKRFYEMMLPEKFIRKSCGIKPVRDYDVILMPAPLPLCIALHDLNRKSESWLLEDGSINYYGEVMDFFGAPYKHLFYLLFHKGVYTISPQRLYVNNIKTCKHTGNYPIFALPGFSALDEPFLQFLRDIFQMDSSVSWPKILYLSQPAKAVNPNESKQIERRVSEVFQILMPYAKEILIRPHPKEKPVAYSGLRIDSNPPMWELACVTSLTEQHILIGSFSTAQITPKLLYDKEPFLIFHYRLFPIEGGIKRTEEITEMVDHLRSSYRNPEKIAVPETLEEFKEVLDRFVKYSESNTERKQ